MDEVAKELVAMGAAAAANCHPCMDHHLAKCDELGISREEVAEAVKVGLMVNRGAERAIRRKARELLGEPIVEGSSMFQMESKQILPWDVPMSRAVFGKPQSHR